MPTKSQNATDKETLHLESNTLAAERGDFLLSKHAVPDVNTILTSDWKTKKRQFHPEVLKGYLSLLELIVLNERLIIGHYNVFAGLDSSLRGSNAFSKLFDEYHLKGDLNLEEEMLKTLNEHKILFEVEMKLENSSPQTCISKYLSVSGNLQQRLDEVRDFAKRYEKDAKVADVLSLTCLASEVGIPLFLSEFALRTQLPYLLHPLQISAVSNVESLESSLRRSVAGHLAESLNDGARRELMRITALGNRTVFPETPISSQIVMEANRPEDFLLIALQLRDNYRDFRKNMIELETELLSEDTSLKKKIKLQKQVDALALELWPDGTPGLRKEAKELSDVVSILSPDTLSIGGAARLTQYILGKPSDLLLKFIRRRKIRVLLKTRKEFLEAKGWPTKLAELFELPKSEIKDALVHAKLSQKK